MCLSRWECEIPWYNWCFSGSSSQKTVKHEAVHVVMIGMMPGCNWVAPEIFPRLYLYLGALSRVLGFATLPIRSIPPATIRLSIDYIEVTLVALPRLSRRYFAEVIRQLSRPGWGRTTQSLYALKLRGTIIGYRPPLVVYGSLMPLLGETYLLHLGAHLSYPWLLVFGFRFSWWLLSAC